MKQPIETLLTSGIIELYVMGLVDDHERAELTALAVSFPEIKKAIADFEKQIKEQLLTNAVLPVSTIKAEILAKIDYQERMKNGEQIPMPPLLHKGSAATDYLPWLSMKGMQLPAGAENITAKIIGATAETSIAVVWIKKDTPAETHTDEIESFLILEGTCIITIGHERFLLASGDYLSIPLHTPHHVKVTSSIPCKAILQRVAA
jgi:mannose-6-phosphate isomerase-like protein (cupin superfamily)